MIGIVLLLDVLEHIKEDCIVQFMKDLVAVPLLTKNAYFVITVPAFPHIYSSHDRLLAHYRRFKLSHLKEIVSLSGYKVIEAGYVFFSLYIIRSIRVIFEKTGILSPLKETEASTWRGSNWLTLLLKEMLLFDFIVSKFFSKTGIYIPGLSCYMICQKHA